MRTQIASVQLDVYTHPALGRRGRITATMSDGRVLPVPSTSEEGEEAGAANIEFQWDRAVSFAREMNVPFLTVDYDLSVKARESRPHREL